LKDDLHLKYHRPKRREQDDDHEYEKKGEYEHQTAIAFEFQQIRYRQNSRYEGQRDQKGNTQYQKWDHQIFQQNRQEPVLEMSLIVRSHE
jgi:hypothetical protein